MPSLTVGLLTQSSVPALKPGVNEIKYANIVGAAFEE
jgi:hypothetical protein